MEYVLQAMAAFFTRRFLNRPWKLNKRCIKSADNGNASDQLLVGIAYMEGCGCKIDYEKSLKYLTKSLENEKDEEKLHSCLFWLGNCYITSKIDYKKGIECLHKSIEKSNFDYDKVQALTFLGKCHFDGIGVEKNYIKAVSLYEKAIECDRASQSQIYLALCYFEGKGVPREDYKKVKYLIKEALNGKNKKKGLALLVESGFNKNEAKDLIKDIVFERGLSDSDGRCIRVLIGIILIIGGFTITFSLINHFVIWLVILFGIYLLIDNIVEIIERS